MKKTIPATALALAFATNFTLAEESKPDHEVSVNAALTSDYRYRGISQTRLRPALQGGADYVNNPTGLYAGTWMSTIKWIKDAGGDGNVELDFYGGKRGEIIKNVSYDIGVLTYVYPSNALNPSADTTEVYGQLGYGPAYVKYSHAVTTLFGFSGSKGSGYLDAGANLDMGNGFTLNLHAGHQKVAGEAMGVSNSRFSYTDWKIGFTKDFGVVTGAFAVIGTRADRLAYASPANGKFLGKNALVFTIGRTF